MREGTVREGTMRVIAPRWQGLDERCHESVALNELQQELYPVEGFAFLDSAAFEHHRQNPCIS